jgi:hypothetical protein
MYSENSVSKTLTHESFVVEKKRIMLNGTQFQRLGPKLESCFGHLALFHTVSFIFIM